MKYEKPDLDIIEFDYYISTVDFGSDDVATEGNVPGVDAGDDDLYN